MKFPRLNLLATAIAAVIRFAIEPGRANSDAPEIHPNSAIVPVPRTDWAHQPSGTRARNAPRKLPAIMTSNLSATPSPQGWEGAGKNVWQDFYGHRKVINFGVGGDRTQHVLWRFEQGQLDGIKAKVAVVMIGTNNSNNKDNTEAEILEGVTAIVQQIRARQPDTKIILLGIFPRGATFSPQRGKILQVNEALAKLDDGKDIFYLDIGPQLIENDGSISKAVMPDYLHPNAAGYLIWANATEPKLKQLLGE